MIFDIEDWARYVRKQRRFVSNNAFYNNPQITHRVSKSFKGEHRQDRNRTICKSPVECMHLHYPGSFDCNSLVSHDCDSEFSRKHVNGDVKSGYQATFGHDEATGGGKELHERRGYFFGGFTLERNDVKVVRGVMDGNCNIGLIRDPLQKPFEECHHVGRWYGRIQAEVRTEEKEIAFLTANLALDVFYKSEPSFLATEFVGTIEGMLIRECKKSG